VLFAVVRRFVMIISDTVEITYFSLINALCVSGITRAGQLPPGAAVEGVQNSFNENIL